VLADKRTAAAAVKVLALDFIFNSFIIEKHKQQPTATSLKWQHLLKLPRRKRQL